MLQEVKTSPKHKVAFLCFLFLDCFIYAVVFFLSCSVFTNHWGEPLEAYAGPDVVRRWFAAEWSRLKVNNDGKAILGSSALK